MSPAEEAAELLRHFGCNERRRSRQLLADRRQRDRAGARSAIPTRRCARAAAGFPRMADGPGAAARRAGAPARRRAARGEAAARQADHARERQDRPGEPRRSPGDDRHLRLRGRPVAPALRPDDRQRAAQPPDDGAMASARAGAGDQRLQLSGRGLGVECRAGSGLRQSGDLEAEREDAALRRSGDGARPPRAASGSAMRPTGWSSSSRASATSAKRWSTIRASRWCRRPARRRWAARSVRASRSASGACCSSLAATMRRSSRRAPISSLRARAILFSAAGTAGQRCTTLRRLIVHESVADDAGRAPARRCSRR